MKILIAYEASQIVTNEFRKLNFEAYSCDIENNYKGNTAWHIKDDAEKIIKMGWDFIGIHPPCTYTALSGNRSYAGTSKREEAAQYTKKIWEITKECSRFAYLEQPMTILQTYIGKCSQKIQPYEFGHPETKETWLWLHNLPKLKPTNIITPLYNRIHKMSPSKNRQRERSETFQGIAEAIAKQYSLFITKNQ